MIYTLLHPAQGEIVIRKSRFIACVQPVADRTAAHAVLDTLRAQHPGARHICWALLAGGHSAAVDDGEPSGTAGRPMLEVLRHQELDGVLASAVRYFGGIKLGAGGLTRAYGQCVAQALKTAHKIPLIPMKTLCCEAAYALEGVIRRRIEAAEGSLLAVRYGAVVHFTFRLPEAAADTWVADLDNAARGEIAWHIS